MTCRLFGAKPVFKPVTTFSNHTPYFYHNSSSCMQIVVIWFKLHWNILLMVQLTRSQHWPDDVFPTNRPHFYQTRSAWSVDQGSNKNHSPAYNFTPTVTKFCVMWEGLSLPHDTKFGNCRCKIVDSRSVHSWSLIHGLRWSGLIKVGPGNKQLSEPMISRFTDV